MLVVFFFFPSVLALCEVNATRQQNIETDRALGPQTMAIGRVSAQRCRNNCNGTVLLGRSYRKCLLELVWERERNWTKGGASNI